MSYRKDKDCRDHPILSYRKDEYYRDCPILKPDFTCKKKQRGRGGGPQKARAPVENIVNPCR
jgi:hypothetical protein